jgi:acyl carrier protein
MTNIKDKVYEIVNKILLIDKEKITDSLSRKDFEDWDSMTHLIIISEIEQTFEIILSDDDIADMNSVADMQSIIGKYEIT